MDGATRDLVVRSLERVFGDRGVDIGALHDGDSLSRALEWDSMDVVDLGLEFKRRHQVKLPEELAAVDSIGRLVALLAPDV